MRWPPVRLLLGVLIAVVATDVTASPREESGRREMIIDGGFHGPLPEPIIDHGGLVWDESLGIVQTRTRPVFDVPRAGGQVGPWTQVSDPINVASVVISGWSRDQSEPRVAIFDRQLGELVIWHGDDLAAPPTHRLSMSRDWNGGSIVDALVGTPFERTDSTHRIASGVMLPGLLMLLLERTEWTEGPAGLESGYAGITIAALQESEGGAWDWVLAEAVANDAPVESRAHGRGYVSAMASYYPTSREPDFTTAFVPFVDYLNHLSNLKANGGQCGLVRLDRKAVGDAWSIGPVAEIASSWGDVGEHYHVAGWTPSGVVLAIGDSLFNRVALLRCADWDRYDDPDQWTIIPRWQGDAPDGSPVLANQFWACCAGNDLDHLIIGGDNVSAAIYGLDVPGTGDESPPRFERVFGEQPSTLFDGDSATTASWIHRDRPETAGPVVARYVCEGGGYPQFSRAIMSTDGETFTTVARLPAGFDRLALPFLCGGRLHVHRQTGAGIAGIHRSTPPNELPVQRGLMVRPGGFDLLRDEMGRHRAPDSIVAAAGITIEQVDPADLPETAGWKAAPDTICYRVRGNPTNGLGRIATMTFVDPSPKVEDIPSNSLGLHLRICNLLSSKMLVQAAIERGGLVSGKTFHIASTGDWNDCDAWTLIAGLSADCTVNLENRAGPEVGAVDFLMVVRSLTRSTGPPHWMLDPVADRQVPGDRVDFPLPIRSETWSSEIELQVPPEGADFSINSRLPVLPVCTWRFVGGGYVSLLHRLGGGEFRVETDRSSIPIPLIKPYHLDRGDVILARLARRDGVLRLSVRAAGSSGSEIAEVSVPAALGPWPSMLRIGGPEHELASGFVVRRLVVETPEDEVGPRPVPPSNPPRPSVIGRRGSNRRAGVPPTPDVFEIASRLGDSGPDLPRHVDLDGDGDVTVLDLSAALRIQRESIGRRGVSRPTRSSAPAP
jgi:hypothetical protein